MGKSPGKWIKTVLFGKKYSKSNFSKNVSPDKKTATKTPVGDSSPNSLVISDPYPLTEIGVETLETDATPLSPVNQGGYFPVSFSDADMKRREEAAAKVQATFRGYLARRAFRALKGIIRLQALIRGHLVRRQAVSTLRCMCTIIKLQAMVHGHKDAKQVSVGAISVFGWQKLATNTFVRRLLVKISTDMPLTLQYDADEPNSSWIWLERWSVSRFWEQPKRAKKTTKPKPQRKSLGPQTSEPEDGKSRRTIRKVPTSANGESVNLTSGKDTSKYNLESGQEKAPSELERNKRNMRKVSSSSSAQVPDKPEADSEKPQPVQSVEIAKLNPTHEVPEIVISPGNIANPDGVVDNPVILETPLKSEENDDHLAVENGVKMESCLNLDNDSSIKEERISKEGQKVKKRRSLPAKQEFNEKISQNLPSVPSYMAATESVKAKLRAQESTPKIGEDGAEYGGNARRHSLPASTNGKLSSVSPRVQKPVQANGKGGSKTYTALKASKDDKVVLPGWRK